MVRMITKLKNQKIRKYQIKNIRFCSYKKYSGLEEEKGLGSIAFIPLKSKYLLWKK